MSNPSPRKPLTSPIRMTDVRTATAPATDAVPESEQRTPASGLRGLDAYLVALDFYRLVFKATRGRVQNERVDQLVRAAESILRNIGEGHPTVGADRARRFRIAANEASECAASLDILEVRGEIIPDTLDDLRALLDRIRAMLWKLSRPR